MDSSDVCGSKISTGKVRPSPLPKTSPEEFSREPSCEKQCTLPQISLTSHLEVFNLLPEDSNSPLLTPKGFVMPSGSSSPYVQKMGPFPPPPNPVEVGVPAMMSSTHPHHSQVKSTTSLGSSPENDPWMVSKILKDTPPPTLRTPDRSIRSVKEKNTESFEQYGYAFWNQTPEGYRRIRKAENDEGEVSQLTEGGAQPTLEPPFYSGIPPLLGFPPPTRFVAPPPSTVSVSSSEALDRTFRISPEATIDLHITNLDQSIQPNEMKRLLAMTFSQQVEVMQVLIHYLADGSYTACIRVPTQQAAQIAISNFQRKKLGKKRIMISYFNNQGKPSALLRSEVKSLLAEVPSCRLPLFRFREVFERRYNTSISVSDLYRMRDIVNITDDNGSGRMISLTRESRMSPSSAEGAGEGSFSAAVCSEHYKVPKRGAGGWAEREAKFDLPNVIIGLKEFEPKIKSLIESHNGRLYLNSLPDCYKDAFGPLPVVDDSQGVPLEHLVTRIRGVRLVRTPTTGVKHLEIVEIPENEDTFGNLICSKSSAGSLASELELLSREVIDLLRNLPCCRIPFSKFIPSYHRHFGKQCRVANYGFTRLIDLLEAISHVVQVLGEGPKQQLTLTVYAQGKRFSSDLLRVLKSQPGKQIKYSQLPSIFEKAYARPFSPCNYGVSYLDDLMHDLTDTVVVSGSDEEKVIALPKREQTPEEIEKTKQFAAETIELLSHAPEFRINFNKFIPAYHHHFGRQCKVADHGFSKLIDLFEAIPEAVQIVDCNDGERWLQLTMKEQLRVLGNQMTTLIKMTKTHTLFLSELLELYRHVYGYSLRPDSYEVESLEDICELLTGVIKVIDTTAGRAILLVDKSHLGTLRIAVRNILGGKPSGKMNLDALLEELETSAGSVVSLKALTEGMDTVLKVSLDDNTVELTPIELFCRNVVTIVRMNEGRMLLAGFDNAYLNLYGVPCRPAMYGFVSVSALLSSIQEVFFFKGKGPRRTIYLKFGAEKMYSNVPQNGPTVQGLETTVSEGSEKDENSNTSQKRESGNISCGEESTFQDQSFRPRIVESWNTQQAKFRFGRFQSPVRATRAIMPASTLPSSQVPYHTSTPQIRPQPPSQSYAVTVHHQTMPASTLPSSQVPYYTSSPQIRPQPPSQPSVVHHQTIARYPWAFQLGVNLQLGMHGTSEFPSSFVATPQPNMFVVSGVPQVYQSPNGSALQSMPDPDQCGYQSGYPVSYTCENL